jgi:hypothetical protein
MWLITPSGFFSIVRKPDDTSGTLTIRARVKSDLEGLRQGFLPGLGPIEENTGTDYRYRAKALRTELADALAQMVQGIDYVNFKDEVAAKQGYSRASIYGKVWQALFGLHEPRAPR